jgi:hypothetical protein
VATRADASVDARGNTRSGALALGAVALLALWLWPLPLLLLAAWATELKVGATATEVVAGRHVDRRSITPMRRVIGVLHLILLVLGLVCAIALPGPMLMAVFVGAVLSIPATYALYTGTRALTTVDAGSSRPRAVAFRGRIAHPQH